MQLKDSTELANRPYSMKRTINIMIYAALIASIILFLYFAISLRNYAKKMSLDPEKATNKFPTGSITNNLLKTIIKPLSWMFFIFALINTYRLLLLVL